MNNVHHARAATLERSLVDLAVESWRFSRLFAKAVEKLDASEQPRHASQIRYFQLVLQEQLEAAGMALVNVEGQPFDSGMAAAPINGGDFGPNDHLVVEQVIEPIVMGPNGLMRAGLVVVRKGQA